MVKTGMRNTVLVIGDEADICSFMICVLAGEGHYFFSGSRKVMSVCH